MYSYQCGRRKCVEPPCPSRLNNKGNHRRRRYGGAQGGPSCRVSQVRVAFYMRERQCIGLALLRAKAIHKRGDKTTNKTCRELYSRRELTPALKTTTCIWTYIPLLALESTHLTTCSLLCPTNPWLMQTQTCTLPRPPPGVGCRRQCRRRTNGSTTRPPPPVVVPGIRTTWCTSGWSTPTWEPVPRTRRRRTTRAAALEGVRRRK